MIHAATIQPINTDFPLVRIAYQSPPYTNNRIYYVCPFRSPFVGLQRRGLFLFSCLTTYTVHLEVVPSTDDNTCAKRREQFVSRRVLLPWSAQIMVQTSLLRKKSSARILKNGLIPTNWKFNPPSAPH